MQEEDGPADHHAPGTAGALGLPVLRSHVQTVRHVLHCVRGLWRLRRTGGPCSPWIPRQCPPDHEAGPMGDPNVLPGIASARTIPPCAPEARAAHQANTRRSRSQCSTALALKKKKAGLRRLNEGSSDFRGPVPEPERHTQSIESWLDAIPVSPPIFRCILANRSLRWDSRVSPTQSLYPRFPIAPQESYTTLGAKCPTHQQHVSCSHRPPRAQPSPHRRSATHSSARPAG